MSFIKSLVVEMVKWYIQYTNKNAPAIVRDHGGEKKPIAIPLFVTRQFRGGNFLALGGPSHRTSIIHRR